MSVLYTNNAKTTLSASLNNSATSLSVASSSGFPSLSGNHYFYATLDDNTNLEVVKVTAVSGTTWTVVRGQDNTSATAFSSGDTIELRLNAALLTDVVNDALASSFTRQDFTGNGSTTAFTLNKTPGSESDLIVFIEGVFQNQADYTLSGTTLTFDEAPASSRKIVVYHVSASVSGDSLALNTFSGDGSTTAFTMSVDPLYENNTMVFIDGVYQNKSTYSTSGTTLTFDAAPANGTSIDVTTHTQQTINVPVDGSVSTAKIAADAVTGAKIADDAINSEHYTDGSIDTAHIANLQVTTGKLAADAVTAAKLADDSVVTANITDDAVTTAKIADDQITLAKLAGLARGKIIYGDSSGNPAALALGSNGQVLKSDGTDIAWATDATVAALTSEEVQDIVGAMFSSNTETGITATYQDADGTVDLVIGDDTIVSSMLDTNISIAGTLGVAGTATFTGLVDAAIIDGVNFKVNGGQGSDGQLLTSTGSGVAWEDAPASGPTHKTFGTSSIMIGDSTTGTIDAANYNTGLGIDVFAALTTGDGNVALGFQNLDALTSGNYNVAIGYDALSSQQTGSACVAIGKEALKLNTVSNNTAVGRVALTANTSGQYNTAIGDGALRSNDTGPNNVAVGHEALALNTTGNLNVAVGVNALDANDDAIRNVAIGFDAGGSLTSGGYNVAIGTYALKTASTTTANVAVGDQALEDTTGEQNTAIGSHVLRENIGGNGNVGLGYYSLGNATTGSYNVAIGYTTMNNAAVTGTYNIALGFEAMRATTSGSENICMGRDAGHDLTTANQNVAIGHEAMTKNSTGTGNVCIGFQAGEKCSAGGNVFIGYKSGEAQEGGVFNVFVGENTRGTHPSHSQAIAIGRDIDAAPGEVAIGTSGLGKIHCTFSSNATWGRSSDVRLKQNITDSALGLDFINDLRPVTYKWKPSNELPKTFPMYDKENQKDTDVVMTGLVAQEVKTALDSAGNSDFAGWGTDRDGIEYISDALFVYPLIKAVNELTAKLEAAEARIEALEG